MDMYDPRASSNTLNNAVDRLKTNVRIGRFDFDTRCILKRVIAGCKQQVEKLNGKASVYA